MLNKETPIKIDNDNFYKNTIPYDEEKEEQWFVYKRILDAMFKDGVISREQWIFCVKRIREKLGQINAY